jgi:hypothetical protein
MFFIAPGSNLIYAVRLRLVAQMSQKKAACDSASRSHQDSEFKLQLAGEHRS